MLASTHTCRWRRMEHPGTGLLSKEPGLGIRYLYKAEIHTPCVGGSSQKLSIITLARRRVLSILRGTFLSSPIPVPVKHPSMSFLENFPQPACKSETIKDGELGGLLAGWWGCHIMDVVTSIIKDIIQTFAPKGHTKGLMYRTVGQPKLLSTSRLVPLF